MNTSNPLDTVSPWWGLGRSEQVALRWLVEHGGQGHASDRIPLAGLLADGHAVFDVQSGWRPTDSGRALYESRHGVAGGREQVRRTTARVFEDASLSTLDGGAT